MVVRVHRPFTGAKTDERAFDRKRSQGSTVSETARRIEPDLRTAGPDLQQITQELPFVCPGGELCPRGRRLIPFANLTQRVDQN